MTTQGLTSTREEMRNYIDNSMRDLYYIVTDMTNGMERMKIPVGSGIVRVCIGHKFERDNSGKQIRVPVFKDFNAG